MLDLVCHVRGGTRREALRWIAEQAGQPLADRPLSPDDRAHYAAAARQAPRLAREAAWWLRERIAELENQAREATTEAVDWGAIMRLAPEIHRLRSLTPTGVIRDYRAAQRTDPQHTAALVASGQAWDAVCRRLVGGIVRCWSARQGEPDAA